MTYAEEITYILRAVAERPISGTDSSCAFCQAYGDEPHGKMDDDSHECVVLTAQRLLGVVPLQNLIFLSEPLVAVFPEPPSDY
jgi:hypothetical protein